MFDFIVAILIYSFVYSFVLVHISTIPDSPHVFSCPSPTNPTSALLQSAFRSVNHLLINMGHKVWLRLLLLFLGFSFVLSSASGSLKAIEEDPSAQYLLAQGTMDMKTDRELLGGFIDVEDNDYPGTGANNHHDPKSPGRV